MKDHFGVRPVAQQELYALADLKAVAVAGQGVMDLIKTGGIVDTEDALDKLVEALSRPRVKALLEGLK